MKVFFARWTFEFVKRQEDRICSIVKHLLVSRKLLTECRKLSAPALPLGPGKKARARSHLEECRRVKTSLRRAIWVADYNFVVLTRIDSTGAGITPEAVSCQHLGSPWAATEKLLWTPQINFKLRSHSVYFSLNAS